MSERAEREPLLTREEVARRLGVQVRTTFRIAMPPAVRVSARIVRWEPSEVEQWIRKRKAS